MILEGNNKTIYRTITPALGVEAFEQVIEQEEDSLKLLIPDLNCTSRSRGTGGERYSITRKALLFFLSMNAFFFLSS